MLSAYRIRRERLKFVYLYVENQEKEFIMTSTSHQPKERLAKIHFAPKGDFSKTLKQRVDDYFEVNNISKYANTSMYLKTLILFGTLFGCWSCLMFVSMSLPLIALCTIGIGASAAGIGFNVMHDGGHKSYSKNNTVNRFMAYSSDLIGASSYAWNIKHNQLHHTYCNINHYDNDLNVGAMARFSPHQPRLWFHRYQHLYMWILYCFIKLKWSYFDDYETFIRGKMGKHPIRRPKGMKLFWFAFGRIFFYTWAVALPLMFHNALSVLAIYLCASAVSGIILAVVFSLAHMSEEASFPEPPADTMKLEEEWMEHQIRTTVNFARNNRILSWYVGGLNFQIEHHLFPKISHIHYPAISSIVESVCAEYEVPYHSHHTFAGGIASHFRQLKLLGSVD